jgi:WD40 repeat protein
VWDLTNGKEVARLTKIWSSVEFSPDGKQLLTSGNGTSLWSADSGKLVLTLSTNFSEAASFSPDGQRVLAIVQIPGGTAADVYDRASGERLRRLGGRVGSMSSASFAQSGGSILTSGSDHFTAIWDVARGQVVQHLNGRDSFVQAAFSPDGSMVVTADRAFGASAWDAATGQPLQQPDKGGRPGRMVDRFQFSNDGSSLVTIGGGRGAVVDPRSNKVRATLEAGGAKDLSAGVFSEDGATVYTTSAYEGFVGVWDAKTGKLEKKLHGFEPGPMNRLALSWDGRLLAANEAEDVVALYSIADKGVTSRLEHPGEVTSIAFSPTEARLVTATRGGTATVWDATTGKSIRKLRGECGTVFSATFSPDGKRVLTACVDGSARLWDVDSGAEELALLSFTDGTWAVVDREGRFDASNDGDIDGLVWVIDDEPYALDQLRAQYYDPGLLSKVLGVRKEPLRSVPSLAEIRPPPLIRLTGPDENGRLEIALEDRGGGVGALFVTLNSSDITATINKKCPAVERGVACAVDLSKLPTWKRGANNLVEAFAEIESGTVRSRGTVREVTAGGQQLTDPPDLWVLAIGVGDYNGTAIDLAYPSSDATRFAEAMRIAGEDGFGAGRVHVRVYGTGSNVLGPPAKDTLDQAVAWMSSGDPGDTLVVFMAGHGVSWSVSGVDDYFYLLPSAGSADDVANPSLRALRAWSGKQIADALAKVPPLKRVVILDTCAAGKFETTNLSTERDLSSDAIRAHARAQERTGAWFLAGAAADKVSYEASRYSQGILTYSLLEGMKGPAVGADDLLLVSDLFEYAEKKVPEYAEGIGGIQKPVIRRGDADDFVIGELPPAGRNRIQLQKVRPVVVRASVVAEGGRPDSLGVESAINRELRNRSAGDAAPIVFWDSDGTNDTWQITGEYTKTDGDVKFSGFLTRSTAAGGGDEIPLGASGPAADDVAKDIVQQVVQKVL